MSQAEVETFIAALPDAARDRAMAVPSLGEHLSELLERAFARDPTRLVSAARLLGHVAARLPGDASLPSCLQSLHAADLHLACGCAQGNAAAVAELDRRHRDELVTPLRRLAQDAQDLDDLLQIVRERLFLGPDGTAPAIAKYDGRGPLGRWLRVTAMRSGLNATRRRRHGSEPEALDAEHLSRALDDPELQLLRARYRDAFRGALLHAIDGLTLRQRRMLRLSVVEGLTVRELGRMYGVHFVTAARNLRGTRDALVAQTRQHLKAELGIVSEELDSIIALIRSRLDVSFARVLESDD